MSELSKKTRPLSIAHRGASAYAPANSLQAFEFAARLGADMWEVDLRLTCDEKLIVFHDECLSDGVRVSDLTLSELREHLGDATPPAFEAVVALAQKHGVGLYADIKASEAVIPTQQELETAGFEDAILAGSDQETVEVLRNLESNFPKAILIGNGVDPVEHADGFDIVHLCWEKQKNPQNLLDDAFFRRCEDHHKRVVLWHEEDPVRMAVLRELPVLGICSDTPELVNPFEAPADWPVQVVCHRGANAIAPENTLPAAEACFAAGFQYVELDVHVTRDRELVVIHDPTLERTTDGKGATTAKSLPELRTLSAGAWFSDHHKGAQVPTFEEFLDTTQKWGGNLYVELKTAPAELVWKAVVARGLTENCFFWSFNMSLLQDLRQLSEDARIMLRRQDFESLEAACGHLNPSLIEFTHEEDLSDINKLQGTSIASMVAYNGKDIDVFRKISEYRPDFVNLHSPFEFVSTMFGKGSRND